MRTHSLAPSAYFVVCFLLLVSCTKSFPIRTPAAFNPPSTASNTQTAVRPTEALVDSPTPVPSPTCTIAPDQTPTCTIAPSPTAASTPDNMPILGQFETKWNSERERWEYIGRDGKSVAYWQSAAQIGSGTATSDSIVLEGSVKELDFMEHGALFVRWVREQAMEPYSQTLLLPIPVDPINDQGQILEYSYRDGIKAIAFRNLREVTPLLAPIPGEVTYLAFNDGTGPVFRGFTITDAEANLRADVYCDSAGQLPSEVAVGDTVAYLKTTQIPMLSGCSVMLVLRRLDNRTALPLTFSNLTRDEVGHLVILANTGIHYASLQDMPDPMREYRWRNPSTSVLDRDLTAPVSLDLMRSTTTVNKVGGQSLLFHFPEGTPVYACISGVARVSGGYDTPNAYNVQIHGDQQLASYILTGSILVKEGDAVSEGQTIAVLADKKGPCFTQGANFGFWFFVGHDVLDVGYDVLDNAASIRFK